MADKKISELDLALLINDDAEFPFSQDNAGEPTTFKGRITQLGTKIAEDMTFSNLQTTSKKLVGAINELLSLGNPIILGTSAPTSSQGANGNLYIQYTAGTGGADDEVDGIYVKIDGAWCEISTGGGGGAGGHTIVDNAGIDLAQRTNLQFLGAYSEDNSTDDTTEVNVVREMTKAEFDELTEAEKTGLINITDITGGNDDRFQPVVYSEEEREIGVWKDGKPLYQKTVDCGTLPNASGIHVAHNISNLADVVCIFGCAVNSSYTSIPLPYPDTVLEYNVNVSVDTTYISISTGRDRTQFTGYITIQYTKTTDQAGSGQWTPQGVPAHHYSTDEQVVGTWIDGSTIYERVFDLGSDISIPNTEFVETSIDATNISKVIQVTGMYSTGVTVYPLMANIGNNKIRLQSDRNGAVGASVRYVILSYTKSV